MLELEDSARHAPASQQAALEDKPWETRRQIPTVSKKFARERAQASQSYRPDPDNWKSMKWTYFDNTNHNRQGGEWAPPSKRMCLLRSPPPLENYKHNRESEGGDWDSPSKCMPPPPPPPEASSKCGFSETEPLYVASSGTLDPTEAPGNIAGTGVSVPVDRRHF